MTTSWYWHRWRHRGIRMRVLGECLHCDAIRLDVLVRRNVREHQQLVDLLWWVEQR